MYSTPEEVKEYLDSLEKDTKAIKKEMFRMVILIEGMSLDDAFSLSYEDRILMSNVVDAINEERKNL